MNPPRHGLYHDGTYGAKPPDNRVKRVFVIMRSKIKGSGLTPREGSRNQDPFYM
jgi:hypothetical protein